MNLWNQLTWVSAALLCVDQVQGQIQLTIGAVPQPAYDVAQGSMLSFKIDIINDYCNDAAVAALGACGTPRAQVTLDSCEGEAWLYANDVTIGQPSSSTYDLKSSNGTTTGYIEQLTFDLVQTVTYIGVYGHTAANFQIYVSDLNFNESMVPRVMAPLAAGDPEDKRGVLTHLYAYSGSVYVPSDAVVSYDAGYLSSYVTETITYGLYYRRMGDVGVATASDIISSSNTMSSVCAVLKHGTLSANTSGTSNTMTMDILGGSYVVAVIGTTTSGYQGAYKALPFTFTPYYADKVTTDSNWGIIAGLIAALVVLVLLGAAFSFYVIKLKWDKREHAKQVLREQLERKALMARGERYEPAKKRRTLTCWERITGEIQTTEDETYTDCLSEAERQTVSEFAAFELGIVAEPEKGRRPSTVVPSV